MLDEFSQEELRVISAKDFANARFSRLIKLENAEEFSHRLAMAVQEPHFLPSANDNGLSFSQDLERDLMKKKAALIYYYDDVRRSANRAVEKAARVRHIVKVLGLSALFCSASYTLGRLSTSLDTASLVTLSVPFASSTALIVGLNKCRKNIATAIKVDIENRQKTSTVLHTLKVVDERIKLFKCAMCQISKPHLAAVIYPHHIKQARALIIKKL